MQELSLPSRERELKREKNATTEDGRRSLPSRERELKLLVVGAEKVNGGSLPSRERELKLLECTLALLLGQVAPLAGA